MDVSTLIDGFLLAKEAEGLKDTSLTIYRNVLKYLKRYLPPEKLEDASLITPQDLQAWVVSMRNLAAATRDHRIAKCKTFFKWAVDNGFLERNPSTVLKRPKETWQPDPFSEEELMFLLDEAKEGRMGVRDYAIICLLLDSGIRNTELRNLRPEDISMKTGQVKIREGKGSKPRTVFIGKRAKTALWRWMMVKPDTEWLFCSEREKKLGRTVLRRLVSIIGKRVGIRAYPHRFRHTFALQYLKLRGDPYSLQYLLGHEDMTVTRKYVKIAAKDVEDLYHSPLDALE